MIRAGLAFVVAVLAALLLSACATGRMIVLQGEPSSLRFLAGEWNGTFTGDARGPEGTLWFSLIAGEDHAHGDVRMAPKDHVPYNRFDPREGWHGVEPATYLDIRWVRMDAFVVEGTLDPFLDPGCNCRAETTFRGTLGDNRIDGTYVTRLANGATRTGLWRALRTKR
jgi:hypothetical protein